MSRVVDVLQRLSSRMVKHVFSSRRVFFSNTPSARRRSTHVLVLSLHGFLFHSSGIITTSVQERIRRWSVHLHLAPLKWSQSSLLWNIKHGGGF